jgi:YD repeat-containing protein
MSDGETSWTYAYDANGMRLNRTDSADAESKQL